MCLEMKDPERSKENDDGDCGDQRREQDVLERIIDLGPHGAAILRKSFCAVDSEELVQAPVSLACIGHKSLEICDQCRLRQQNSPATPENSAAFWREEFLRQFVLIHLFKTGS